MFDTHAHLTDPAFEHDLEQVIRNARDAGVTQILTVGLDIASSRSCVEITEKQTDVYAAIGIHPESAGVYTGDLNEIEELAVHPKVAAIGEAGLDYYRDYGPHLLQAELFRKHICLAKKVNKPLVIHTRKSYDAAMSILSDEDFHCGVFHCFSADLNFAARVIEAGFYISFSGSITYEGKKLSDVASKLPKDKILIETDCPYLTPVPLRGKRNEPAFVQHVANKLASILAITIDEVDQLTTQNAKRLFRLP